MAEPLRKLLAQRAPGVSTESVGSIESAVRRASGLARPGDVVLLSPACTSYDQFVNYEQRGRVFKDAVAAVAVSRSMAAGEGGCS
jgi:UDP-N-acetylmuramoylalanine--D-glutamate ligase